MKPRLIVCIVFFLTITILSVICHFVNDNHRPSSAEWMAATTLPRNTLIEINHLQKPHFPTPAASWRLRDPTELIGKYTSREVQKGERILPEVLTAFPAVSAEANTTLFFFAAPHLGVQLNAGARVCISDANSSSELGPYIVEVVYGKSASTALLIRATNTEVFALKKLAKPQVRLAGVP